MVDHRPIWFVASVLLLAIACDESPTPTVSPDAPPPSTASACPSDLAGSPTVATWPADNITWTGNLNNDGFEDLIVRDPDACGNWGECPWAIYVGCADGTYVAVWGPEYTFEIRDPTPTGADWTRVIRIDRTGDAADDRAYEVPMDLRNGAYEARETGEGD